MGTDPRHAKRKRQAYRRRSTEQMKCASCARQKAYDQAQRVDNLRGERGPSDQERQHRNANEGADAKEWQYQRHSTGLFSRTPRPPLMLVALSEISSIPAASSAPTSFIKESTLPRITPSLASMR